MPTKAKKQKRRPPLSRERVLETALAMVDRAGVESLSMRAVAAELGVEAMSLYRHVASKEALLEGLVAVILDEIEVPPAGTRWREAMKRRALSTREVFLKHPAAAILVESCATMTPSRLAYSDAVVGLLLADGFTPSQAYKAFLTIDSYVFGFVMQELSWPHPGDTQPSEDAATAPAVPPALYPHFARVMGSVMEEVGRLGLVGAYESEFVAGLDLVLDGVDRLR
ncbi:MAG: TetR/AcrR family transcriptional regulator C-terminal domain-containing protein [Sandaracinaceae bacterium]|nr:TetR/AcrR family transcriptional regulator C-terminal domain-containing protein [Sandaracinaceae bacterium]